MSFEILPVPTGWGIILQVNQHRIELGVSFPSIEEAFQFCLQYLDVHIQSKASASGN
jgi:hypothetical protein